MCSGKEYLSLKKKKKSFKNKPILACKYGPQQNAALHFFFHSLFFKGFPTEGPLG